MRALSILIVAENISAQMSGETIVPWYYLNHLRDLGQEVHAICHVRVREHLRADLDDAAFARVHFVEDGRLQKIVHRIGRLFPYRVEDLIFNQIINLLSQLRMRAIVRRLVSDHGIDIVFQPAPIAAKAVSAMHDLGVPVVIGPMSGGMELPPAFRSMDGLFSRWAVRAARAATSCLHRLVPGKLRADALIVANGRTRRALPPGTKGKIHWLMESGVDLARWEPASGTYPPSKPVVSFIFCSRFVDWKGIRYLVRAFAPIAREGGARLDLVGDGELFDEIRDQINAEAIAPHVTLHGRVSLDRYAVLLREADVYVSPSLRECGGIAMMEAMAMEIPVIGVKWGGAEQYAEPAGALLVDPASEDAFVEGLTVAMRKLANDPALRRKLGLAGRRHIEDAGLTWEAKARQVLDILHDTIAASAADQQPGAAAPAIAPLEGHPA